MLRCDLSGKDHVNGHNVSEEQDEEASYVGNFQKPDPYSNTYNIGWKDHPNFEWSNNQGQSVNLRAPHNPPSRKSSLLE